MSKNKEEPTPDESGSSGTQVSTDTSLKLERAQPLVGLHIANTVEGLASSHAKSLGGEVASALIAGSMNQLALDYQELKADYRSLNDRYEEQRNELEKVRTEKAVLAERINSDRKNKHLRNLSITIGTSLIGVGIILSKSALDNYAFGAYGFGVLLLGLGWLSGPKEAAK